MYYHNVLVVMDFAFRNTDDMEFKQSLGYLGRRMEKAQRFHLGDIGELLHAGIGPSHNDHLFQGEWGIGVNPPYDIIWVDFQHSGSTTGKDPKKDVISKQGGILAIKNGDDLDMFPCYSAENVEMPPWGNRWSPPGLRITKKSDGPLVSAPLASALSGDAENRLREIWTMNMFLKLINCRNITTSEVLPAAKLNKKRLKKGKNPLVSYHVLDLVLPAKRTKSAKGETTGTTRLHLCRGHFKTYTEDAPLMGRHVGTYWWQATIKGNKKMGLVDKRYNVTGENV